MSERHIVSKGEFARILGVSPGRVTQYFDEGKISGDAIVGEGRAAKIDVDIARQQIQLRRDPGQALGNGLATRLAGSPRTRVDDDDDVAPPLLPDDIDRKLKLARLDAADRANRMAAIEEAAAEGLYTETATVRAELGRIASQMIRIVEGALPEIATAIAAQFKLEARDVTHHLNEQFRKVREKAAQAAEEAANALPETIDTAAA